MIQGSLNVSGAVQPSASRTYPAVAAATVVGLTDHDLNVMDDQSVVITDYYSEQIKTRHVTLQGADAGGTGAAFRAATGRVTIAAVKSDCYTPDEFTIDNYHGTLYYSSSFFMVNQKTVVADVNMTFVGNAFWGDNATAFTFKTDAGATGHVSTLGL